MIKWFEPKVLFRAAIKSIVSSLFGNYADRREMESALDTHIGADSTIKANDPSFDYSTAKDLWIDFVADTGDGFNSTYSVAHLVASDLDDKKGTVLKKGSLLILGGDQIYPAPTREDYENKFHIPFEAALPFVEDDKSRPQMFAIPGNHDWYDGLGNFLKLFCQKRRIGNWETKQRRSYFALKLPHNYWLWGIDIQLSEDIDEPQQRYFERLAPHMIAGDKVILVTAKPAWVVKGFDRKEKSYDILEFFIRRYITDDSICCMGKTFKLVALLSGDLHHYSRYISDDPKSPVQFITAGGGGAALHLTHNLPKGVKLTKEKSKDSNGQAKDGFGVSGIEQKQIYPSQKISKRLVASNLLFFWKNKFFGYIFGVFYCLVYWLLQSNTLAANKPYMTGISNEGGKRLAKSNKRCIGLFPCCHYFMRHYVLWLL